MTEQVVELVCTADQDPGELDASCVTQAPALGSVPVLALAGLRGPRPIDIEVCYSRSPQLPREGCPSLQMTSYLVLNALRT